MTSGYGYFPGGDPRKFHPDLDCCSEKEIEAHRLACEAWNRGEMKECPPGSGVLVDSDGKPCGFWDGGPFGIGGYEMNDEDDDE